MDDGARDRDTNLAMLRIAAETGTTDIGLSPELDWKTRRHSGTGSVDDRFAVGLIGR
jgi:hypothetical protein